LAATASAHRELFGYFQDLVRYRQGRIDEDLISVLISARAGRHRP
jgi:hypothetical protein